MDEDRNAGSVIPEGLDQAFFEEFWRRGLVEITPSEPVKLTKRQRILMDLRTIRWRIHDWMFPDCRDDDW